MKFIKSFTVTIKHPFFNGAAAGYRFESVPRSRQYSKRSVFRLRSQANQVVMLQDLDKEDAGMPRFVDIAVYPSDPLFQNLSNLEINYKEGNIYYLCNDPAVTDETDKSKRKTTGMTTGMTLIESNSKNEYQAVPVRFRPRQFLFPVEGSKGDFFTITDHEGTEIKTWNFEAAGSRELLMDLRKWPEGFFILNKNGTPHSRFYLMDPVIDKNQKGIVKKETPPAFIIGIKTDVKPGVQFQVEIAARSVVWQYVIHLQSNGRKPGNLLIKNNNKLLLTDVTFDQQEQSDVKQVVFRSSRPIEMMAKGYGDIELYENAEAATPLIHHLPNAQSNCLHFIDGQWLAPIHVNI